MRQERARPVDGGDVVINSVPYTLWRDPSNPDAGLAWKAVDGTDLLEGTPDAPATEEWPYGWAGGMGESIRISPDSAGYAFSSGFDCSKPGVMRLPSTRVTLTPSAIPTDNYTQFWTDRPTGAAEFATGSFAAGSATPAHGMSQTPVAVIFMITGQATAADGTIQSADVTYGIGWADGDGNNAGISYFSDNAAGTTNAERSYSITDSILTGDGAGAYTNQGKVTSIDTNNFNITWTQNDGAAIVQWWAIAGAQASVDGFTKSSDESPEIVTGVGFQPHLVLFLSTADSAAGFNDGARFGIGAADGAGNVCTLSSVSVDGAATSDTASVRHSNIGLAILTDTSTGDEKPIRSIVMNPDGFTAYPDEVVSGNVLISALSLRNVSAQVGNTAVTTAGTEQPAEDALFTSTSFLIFGTTATTDQTVTADASFGMGMVAATDSVQASAYHDEDNQATTDTDTVFDTGAAMMLVDDTSILEEATCGNADIGTAGWLTWSAQPSTAHLLSFIALKAETTASDLQYIYCGNGSAITKMTVASGLSSITEQQSRTKSGGVLGPVVKFDGNWHIPWGTGVSAEYISTVGYAVDDSYADINGSPTALAFATQMDGATSKLLRAHTSNLIDASQAGGESASFGSDFEVGDTSSVIQSIQDSGTSVFVAKTDGLYQFEQPGIAFPVTHIPVHGHTDVSTHGVGLLSIHGTDACLYNHASQLFFYDGASLPDNISPDSNPLMAPLDNIGNDPVAGEWLESCQAGNWFYALYRIPNTSSDDYLTYIMAFYRAGTRWIFHSYNLLGTAAGNGNCRGLDVIDINGVLTLWTCFVSDGTIGFYVIGRDGQPFSGLDTIGQGEVSTTYTWYGPEVLHSAPLTNKQLWRYVIVTKNVDSTCPVILRVHRDSGSQETPSATTITSNGQSIRYWTLGTNDTAMRSRPQISMTTTAGYNTSTDPQILSLGLQVYPRPDRSRTFQVIIDTQLEPLGIRQQIDDAKTIRDNLVALTGDAAPVSCTDPDGNSINLKIAEVRELALRAVDANNETVAAEPDKDFNLHWTIECKAIEVKSS